MMPAAKVKMFDDEYAISCFSEAAMAAVTKRSRMNPYESWY